MTSATGRSILGSLSLEGSLTWRRTGRFLLSLARKPGRLLFCRAVKNRAYYRMVASHWEVAAALVTTADEASSSLRMEHLVVFAKRNRSSQKSERPLATDYGRPGQL